MAAYLKDVVKLLNQLPLILVQLEFPQAKVLALSDFINHLSMLQRILPQVEGRIPSGGNVLWHEGDDLIQFLQGRLLDWEDTGG